MTFESIAKADKRPKLDVLVRAVADKKYLAISDLSDCDFDSGESYRLSSGDAFY